MNNILIFNNEEKNILNHFFTSSNEKDVIYAAKETMPNFVIAYLIGKASRSKKTFREMFLEEYNNIKETTNKPFQNNKNEIIDEISKKSMSFFKKWDNHHSLKDIPHIAIFCDDLSILQTKVWEYERLAEYQEKSTRYRKFNPSNVFIPDLENKYLTPNILSNIFDLTDNLVDLYNNILDECGKKDVARYVLPVGLKTSMACYASLRVWRRIVERMWKYPTKESRNMAINITNHILKIYPYFIITNDLPNTLFDFLNDNAFNTYEYESNIDVLSYEKDIISIDGILDIGAHRDIQRHRSVKQTFPDYRPLCVYETDIMNSLSDKLKEKYKNLMNTSLSLFNTIHGELKNTYIIGESQYCSLLGHYTKFNIITDLNEWKYIHDLRTGSSNQNSTTPKTVHFSYSNWCKKIQEKIDEKINTKYINDFKNA